MQKAGKSVSSALCSLALFGLDGYSCLDICPNAIVGSSQSLPVAWVPPGGPRSGGVYQALGSSFLGRVATPLAPLYPGACGCGSESWTLCRVSGLV